MNEIEKQVYCFMIKNKADAAFITPNGNIIGGKTANYYKHYNCELIEYRIDQFLFNPEVPYQISCNIRQQEIK